MALDKNKAGIMAAISAAQVGKAPVKERAHRSLPRGTVGSVRAGLGGIQDIDTDQIIGWGPKDRLELTAVNSADGSEDSHSLIESIRASGQQVPVLLRPSEVIDGKFDVIYGRRRILACRELNIPVKALIRTLDDREALLAKGLENSSRIDLSFYERARFATSILAQGHTRDATMQALSISKNSLSQLERITRLIPEELGNHIGAAPNAGRPKWMALASALEDGRISVDALVEHLSSLPKDTSSDMRLESALELLTRRGTKERPPAPQEPLPGVAIKSGKSSISLTVKRSGESKAFADWLDQNLEHVLKESFRTFTNQSDKGAS